MCELNDLEVLMCLDLIIRLDIITGQVTEPIDKWCKEMPNLYSEHDI